MDRLPRVLLTNDDGIDHVGLRAIHDALAGVPQEGLPAVADVTVVAPAEDRSGVGRSDTRQFAVREHDLGHAVEGNPADCVQYGVAALEPAFDLVVSGCNPGPNAGAHVVDRSGTVGAAREAAFLGIDGIALSLFDPPEGGRAFEYGEYAEAQRVARYFVETLASAGIGGADYLNVNVPANPATPRRVRVTEPVHDYAVDLADREGRTISDHFWDPLRPGVDADVTDPVGTDRRALADREVSVTPLSIRQAADPGDGLAALTRGYVESVEADPGPDDCAPAPDG